ncbi:MAG: cyclic nucleotide-binding domain-containing protein [Candidatus Limnocylindrales bacterium]
MPVNADLLRLVPLFAGMTDRSFEAIATVAADVAFEEGDDLRRQGEAGTAFFIIVSGRARVDRDGSTIRELGPGDFLGEIALIDGSPRTATVTALEPIAAVTIRRSDFLDLVERQSVFRLEMLNALTQRFRATGSAPLG